MTLWSRVKAHELGWEKHLLFRQEREESSALHCCHDAVMNGNKERRSRGRNGREVQGERIGEGDQKAQGRSLQRARKVAAKRDNHLPLTDESNAWELGVDVWSQLGSKPPSLPSV